MPAGQPAFLLIFMVLAAPAMLCDITTLDAVFNKILIHKAC